MGSIRSCRKSPCRKRECAPREQHFVIILSYADLPLMVFPLGEFTYIYSWGFSWKKMTTEISGNTTTSLSSVTIMFCYWNVPHQFLDSSTESSSLSIGSNYTWHINNCEWVFALLPTPPQKLLRDIILSFWYHSLEEVFWSTKSQELLFYFKNFLSYPLGFKKHLDTWSCSKH